MASYRSLLRVLVVLGFAVLVTASTYLLAGLSVGAWLLHERAALHGWGPIADWNQPVLALPAIVIGYIAGRMAMGVRAERRQTERA